MTTTAEELREWSAEKVMGWVRQNPIDKSGFGDLWTHNFLSNKPGYIPGFNHIDGTFVPEKEWNDNDYYLTIEGGRVIRIDDWTTDTDLNQAFMVVERMRELGWTWDISVQLNYEIKPPSFVCYESGFRPLDGGGWIICYDINPALAILLAVHATGEGREKR